MRRVLVAFVVASLVVVAPAATGTPANTGAAEVIVRLTRSATARLPFAANHVAVFWTGHSNADVRVGFGTVGPLVDAGRDDIGGERGNGVTYGALLRSRGARIVRLVTDEPIGEVSVLALR